MSTTVDVHHLPAAVFEALARGVGGPDAIRLLAAGQTSKRLLLLRLLLGTAHSAWLDEYADVLDRAQRAAPEAAASVLAIPHIGSWAATTLRQLRTGTATEVDLGHLGAIAAAAATRAGIPFAMKVPTRDGTLFLPGFGLATALGTDHVEIRSDRTDGLHVGPCRVPDDPAGDAPGWSGLRQLTSSVDGLTIRVSLDDLDPFRDCHRLSATGRLPAADLALWQRLFDNAWEILVGHHREYAEGIALGLRTLVPLHPPRTNLGVNVTSMDAFGAVSLTSPADPLSLAVTLLHEFQHGKLGAVMDLVPLYRPGDPARYYAPWRDDPRPLGGLLHGVYAFLGVTDFWRVQRQVLDGGLAELADLEFARWRDRVWRTHEILAGSGMFTPAGEVFLDGLRATQMGWRDEPVPEPVRALAADAAQDHWIGWRLRNLRPDPEAVAALAGLWRAGVGPSTVDVPTAVVTDDQMALVHNMRSELARIRITDPDRFAVLRTDPEALGRDLPDASAGDAAYVDGDIEGALTAYRLRIVRGADRGDDPRRPWVGLVLALRAGSGCPPHLAARPELVYALHRAISATGQVPEPVALARWLAPTPPPPI